MGDAARSQSPRITTPSRKCTLLHSDFDLQYITAVLPSVAPTFVLNTGTMFFFIVLLFDMMELLTMSEKDIQGISNKTLSCCGAGNKMPQLFVLMI